MTEGVEQVTTGQLFGDKCSGGGQHMMKLCRALSLITCDGSMIGLMLSPTAYYIYQSVDSGIAHLTNYDLRDKHFFIVNFVNRMDFSHQSPQKVKARSKNIGINVLMIY